MGVAAEHWACTIQHPPRTGYRTGREHSVGCEVAEGHDPDRPPFRCRICVRGYRPPRGERRVRFANKHFACAIARADHVPPVERYSKTGHRDDCPTAPGHSGKQGSGCVGCRSEYRGIIGLPLGRLEGNPHWSCEIPPEEHKPLPMYGVGHRPGCGVGEGHTADVVLKGCKKCRQTQQQGNMKTARMKKKYRLSREEYDAMMDAQGGVCAICGEPPSAREGGPRTSLSLHIDHDHATAKVRGLLCYACNLGLGYFRDDPDRIASAIEYLRART